MKLPRSQVSTTHYRGVTRLYSSVPIKDVIKVEFDVVLKSAARVSITSPYKCESNSKKSGKFYLIHIECSNYIPDMPLDFEPTPSKAYVTLLEVEFTSSRNVALHPEGRPKVTVYKVDEIYCGRPDFPAFTKITRKGNLFLVECEPGYSPTGLVNHFQIACGVGGIWRRDGDFRCEKEVVAINNTDIETDAITIKMNDSNSEWNDDYDIKVVNDDNNTLDNEGIGSNFSSQWNTSYPVRTVDTKTRDKWETILMVASILLATVVVAVWITGFGLALSKNCCVSNSGDNQGPTPQDLQLEHRAASQRRGVDFSSPIYVCVLPHTEAQSSPDVIPEASARAIEPVKEDVEEEGNDELPVSYELSFKC